MNNYKILSIIIPATSAWFWLGIWILFYLRFTDFAGIGLLESLQIAALFFLEIPTGSLADIIGKKKNIVLGMALLVIGNLFMAFAVSYIYLIISVFFLSFGIALLSGSWQSLLYDSLEGEKLAHTYEKKIAVIERNKLIVMAVSSLIGGYLYSIDFRYPFYASTVAGMIGLVAAFYLYEPTRKTLELSMTRYIHQLQIGFKSLFIKNKNIVYLCKLLLVASFFTILIEVLDPALAIDKGLDETGLGWLYFIVPLITAMGVHYYDVLKKWVSPDMLLLWIAITFSLTLIVSPVIPLSLMMLSILYRNIFYSFTNIIAASNVSAMVSSKDRATSISTFTAIASMPYALVAFSIGGMMDNLGASVFAFYLGFAFMVLYFIVTIFSIRNRKADSIINL